MSYLMLSYLTEQGGVNQVACIDLDTGGYDLVDADYPQSLIKNWMIAARNGDDAVYLGTTQAYGPLWKYVPSTGVISKVVNDIAGIDRDWYRCAVGPTGIIYWGTYSNGHLISYDPDTATFHDHGAGGGVHTGGQWLYRPALSDNGNWAVGVMGQNPWYAVVFNLADDEDKTVYWDDELLTFCQPYVSDDANHTVYINHTQTADGYTWHYLDEITGELVGIATGSVPSTIAADYLNVFDYNVDDFSANYDLEINLDNATPYTGKPISTILYRWGGSGPWTQVDIEGVYLKEETVKRLIGYDSSEILAVMAAYGPFVTFDVSTSVMTYQGLMDQTSVFDVIKASSGKFYIAGYPNKFWEWESASAWDLTPSTVDTSASNPREIVVGHKYNYFLCEDSVGLIWIGVHHERTGTGGELDWFDPSDDSLGEDSTTFDSWECGGLCPAGDYVIYSGFGGGDSQLFVCEVGSPITVVDTWTPITSYTEAIYLVPVSATDVIGIGLTKAFRIDITTGTVAWTTTLPGDSWNGGSYVNRRAEVHGGYIYFPCESSLYKMNITNGALTLVMQSMGTRSAVWFNDKAYTADDKVYWIEGLT